MAVSAAAVAVVAAVEVVAVAVAVVVVVVVAVVSLNPHVLYRYWSKGCRSLLFGMHRGRSGGNVERDEAICVEI